MALVALIAVCATCVMVVEAEDSEADTNVSYETSMNFYVGQTINNGMLGYYQTGAAVQIESGSIPGITISSTFNQVLGAIITGTGTFTTAGSYTITFSNSYDTYLLYVDVSPTFEVGETIDTIVGITHSDTSSPTITANIPGITLSASEWVNGSGEFYVRGTGTFTTAGDYTVTVSSSSYTDTFIVHVEEAEDDTTYVTSITLSASNSSPEVGDTITFSATTRPTDADNRYVTWAITSGSAYASITSTTDRTTGGTATVSANAAGTFTITATAADGSGVTASRTITISEPAALVTSVSISGSTTVNVGSTLTLTATTSPSSADDRTVVWSITSGSSRVTYTTSDTSTGGRIVLTGVSAGSVTVRAEAADGGGAYATHTVTVVDPSNTFTLAFDANGGSGAPSSQNYTSTSSTYNATIPATTPSRSGYTFLGWATSSSATSATYEPGDTIVLSPGTTTLYAVWEEDVTPVTSITIDSDDHVSIEGGPLGTGTSTQITVTATTSPAGADDRGVTFTLTDGTGSARIVSQSVTDTGGTAIIEGISPGAVTLTATATDGSGVTATRTIYVFLHKELFYDANGGTGAPSGYPTDSTASSHTTFISSTEPTRDGYVFLGWATTSTATEAEYGPGDSITIYGDTTLYAVWETATLSITTTQNNVSLTVGQSFNYTVGTSHDGCTVSVSGADWLSVSGSTVSGTATSAGVYEVTVTVSKDGGYTSATQTFTITVYSSIGFTSEPEFDGIYVYATG